MPETKKKTPWAMLGLIVAIALASVTYRAIAFSDYPKSGLMFVGLPTILAILIALSGQSKSPTTQIFKGTSMFLLIVLIFAWEGFVCVLMAAPIFFTVALIVSWLCERARKRDRLSCLGLIPIALLSFEGTGSLLSLEREHSVHTSKIISISKTELLEKLALAPSFDSKIPTIFRLGFPIPKTAESSGALATDHAMTYFIQFSGPPEYGNTLHVRTTQFAQNQINFQFPSDSTKISDWLTWKEASISWTDTEQGLEVNLELKFQRNLDPVWYFGPLQQYAVERAGNYLLESWINE